MTGSVPLGEEEETPRLPLSAMWAYHIVRRHQSASQEEGPHQKEPSHTGTLISHFSASRTVKNKCQLFKPSSLWCFIEQTNTGPFFLHYINYIVTETTLWQYCNRLKRLYVGGGINMFTLEIHHFMYICGKQEGGNTRSIGSRTY